jgi:hypothetical protein
VPRQQDREVQRRGQAGCRREAWRDSGRCADDQREPGRRAQRRCGERGQAAHRHRTFDGDHRPDEADHHQATVTQHQCAIGGWELPPDAREPGPHSE